MTESSPYQQGLAKLQAKDFSGAILEFDQAIALQPDVAEIYYKRGFARFHLGDLSWAIADYTIALRLDPGNSQIYFGRSLAYLSQGELKPAIADATQLIQLDPNHAAAHELLGTAQNRSGHPASATTHYKRAAELYLNQKDAGGCRRCIDQIQLLHPSQPTAVNQGSAPIPSPDSQDFLQQAVDKASCGDRSSAIEDLDWAIRVNPQDVSVYVARAKVLKQMGSYHSAIEDYRQAALMFSQQGDQAQYQEMQKMIQQLQQDYSQSRIAAVSRLQTPRDSSPHFGSPDPSTSGRISPVVLKKLMRLVGDDRRIAVDLVEKLKQKHPGMPENWYWEKAIYDLERDRH